MRPDDVVNDAGGGPGRAALPPGLPAWLATFIRDAERENETLELRVNGEQTLGRSNCP